MLSTSANNFGTLLSGIGTLALAIASIYILWSFRRFKIEKRVEKKSLLAEALLKQLNSLEREVIEWVEWMPFVFPDEEKISDQSYPYKMSDCEKKAKELLDGLDSIEVDGSILVKNVSHLVKPLEDFIKEKRSSLRVVCFVNSTKDMVNEAYKKLSPETLQNFRNNVSILRKELLRHIFYENL